MTRAMEGVMELTGDLIKGGAVDTNRVYIMGLSMGGIATYETVYRFPNLFAGAVAVCGAGDSSAYTACTAKVPFLIYHGDADPVVGVKESQGMYQRLTGLGGDAQIITYPGVGHNSWRNAFASPDLLPQLFSKTRATVAPTSSTVAHTLTPVQHTPAPVIFETDMGNDVDDALALDMLYKYMDEGRINLLAVNSNKNNGYSPAFIQLMNNWYGYPDIPVGKMLNGANSQDNIHEYVRAVCEYRTPDGRKAFHAPDTASGAFKDPVALYREILARQPDHSVTIISVGFSTNLARLLESRPDSFSLLDGRALVEKKVKLLSAMAGDFTGKNNAEYNVVKDIGAATDLFTKWPGEIVVSPYELGRAITYPARSIENDFAWAVDHPVVLAYKNYMTMPYDRPTWDLTAALYGVEGAGQYFGLSPKGTVSIDKEGHSFFTPSATGRHRYLLVNEQQATLIRDRFVSLITGMPKYYQKAK
jgi:inosine-uridine nucleoside N-ribohydrolase